MASRKKQDKQPTIRREVLESAAELVDGDRNSQYGDPIQDFQRTASYWNTHLSGVFLRNVTEGTGESTDDLLFTVDEVMYIINNLIEPHDVAIMMMQLKHSRLAWSPEKADHWIDAAGYAACGYDCVSR